MLIIWKTERLHVLYLTHTCLFFHKGKSARSSQTSWPRIAVRWATHGRFLSWTRASKAAWPTSASSHTALAHQPSALPWPRCRTTSMRLWSRWTKCTLMQLETPHKAPQMEAAKLWTRWTNTGSEASSLLKHFLRTTERSVPRHLFVGLADWLMAHCSFLHILVFQITVAILFALPSNWRRLL